MAPHQWAITYVTLTFLLHLSIFNCTQFNCQGGNNCDGTTMICRDPGTCTFDCDNCNNAFIYCTNGADECEVRCLNSFSCNSLQVYSAAPVTFFECASDHGCKQSELFCGDIHSYLPISEPVAEWDSTSSAVCFHECRGGEVCRDATMICEGDMASCDSKQSNVDSGADYTLQCNAPNADCSIECTQLTSCPVTTILDCMQYNSCECINACADMTKLLSTPTEAPTTVSPTTNVPTTNVPTTAQPTTSQPTTNVPTTSLPTTNIPTTNSPTTNIPTTNLPTTYVPTTNIPTTNFPTTNLPTTASPVTSNPTSSFPTTMSPTTDSPTTVEPTTNAPTTAQPTTISPTTAQPTTTEPTTASPTTAQPTSLAPTTKYPTTHEPSTNEPTISPITREPTSMVPTGFSITAAEPTISPVSTATTDEEAENKKYRIVINTDNINALDADEIITTVTNTISTNDLHIVSTQTLDRSIIILFTVPQDTDIDENEMENELEQTLKNKYDDDLSVSIESEDKLKNNDQKQSDWLSLIFENKILLTLAILIFVVLLIVVCCLILMYLNSKSFKKREDKIKLSNSEKKPTDTIEMHQIEKVKSMSSTGYTNSYQMHHSPISAYTNNQSTITPGLISNLHLGENGKNEEDDVEDMFDKVKVQTLGNNGTDGIYENPMHGNYIMDNEDSDDDLYYPTNAVVTAKQTANVH